MIKIIEFIRERRLISSLILIGMISFILSLVFIVVLDGESLDTMSDSINTYFSNIKNNNIDYKNNFIISLINNISVGILIWLLGISIVGLFLIFIIFFIKCFITYVSFFSIIKVYGIRGLILSFVYIIPYIINIFVLFILSYYAISFSILLFNYFFKNKNYNRIIIVKRYLKVLGICLLLFVVISLIDALIIPRILLLF